VDRSRRPAAAEPDDFENVLRLRLASGEQRGRERRLGREGAAMLQAVKQASLEMTATENRARDIEARGVALAERALQQLKAAESRIQAAEEAARVAESRILKAEARAQRAESHLQEAEARAQEAETRAQQAEARAQEAEEWLTRLNEAIEDSLLRRSGASNSTVAA